MLTLLVGLTLTRNTDGVSAKEPGSATPRFSGLSNHVGNINHYIFAHSGMRIWFKSQIPRVPKSVLLPLLLLPLPAPPLLLSPP